MARKTIQRDLHDKKADFTKAYSVIGQRGQLRVDQKASKKVSTPPASEKEEPPVVAPPAVEKKPEKSEEALPVKEKESEVVEEIVDMVEEVPTEPKVSEETKKPVSKFPSKKTAKKGRPRKAAVQKAEEKEE